MRPLTPLERLGRGMRERGPLLLLLLLLGPTLASSEWKAAGRQARAAGDNESELTMITQGQMFLMHSGERVTLSCQFHSDSYSLFENPVLWKKTQRYEHSQVNIMSNIYQPFMQTNRFFVDFQADPPRFTMELTIAELQQEDSGNYSCEVRGRASAVIGQVTHYVFVRAPVKDLYLMNHNGSVHKTRHSLTYEENEPGIIRCVSVGGYPPPDMQVFVGDMEITDRLSRTSVPRLSGVLGLRVMTYTTSMWSDEFIGQPEYDGLEVHCVSSVAGLGTNSTSATLAIHYAPLMTCQDATAYLGQRNVHLHCDVHARPAATAVFWVLDREGTTLTEGEIISEYWTLILPGRRGATQVKLFMGRTRPESFRTYTIVAENHVGISTQEVVLREIELTTVVYTLPPTKKPPPPTKKPPGYHYYYISRASGPLGLDLGLFALALAWSLWRLGR